MLPRTPFRRRLPLVLPTLLALSVASFAQEPTDDARGAQDTNAAQDESPAPDANAAQDTNPAPEKRRGIRYTPSVLPEKGLGEFPGFENKRIRMPLSLADAVRIAVRNNLLLKIEQFNERIARRQITIERAAFDPLFSLSLSRADNREPTVSPLDFDPLNPVLGVRVNPFDVTTLSTGLRGTTILGTQYQLTASESRFDSPEASLFALNPRYSSNVEIALTQPLLRGGWYATNSANLRIARNNLKLTEDQAQLTAIETIVGVISAYWDLVFAHQNYRAKASALSVAIDQVRIDRRRAEVGAISPVDLITPESQLARRKTEFDQAINVYESTRDTLLNLCNYTGKNSLKKLWLLKDEKSPFENILLIPTTEPDPQPVDEVDYDRDASLEKAFAFRVEYRSVDLQLKNQEIVVDLTRNQLLPSLDITGSWTQLGLGEDFSRSLKSLDTGLFYNWQVGVNFEFPLTYRGPLNNYYNAQDEYKKLGLQKQDLENSIVNEVDQAIRDLRESYRAVQNLAHEVQLQEALLEAEKLKLEAGRSIAYTVSQIQNDLVDIRTQENLAKTNYEKFRAAYRRAIGTLLESYQVVFVRGDQRE